MTNKQISGELSLDRTTIASITRMMVINNQIKQGESIASSSTKHASTFYVAG